MTNSSSEPNDPGQAGQGEALETFDQAGELAALAAEVGEDPAADQATPGQAAADDPAGRLDTGQIITDLAKAAFSLLAPAWRVTDDECAALGQAWAPIADQALESLFPGGVAEGAGPWLTAIPLTLAVIGPRIGRPRTLAQDQAGQVIEGEPGQADAPPGSNMLGV